MLESGQELSARFVVARRLGGGGSGSVWLAQDRERRCFVAVKILSDDLMRYPAAIRALEREYEALSRLQHPNVLRVDGLHRSTSHLWISMEYASGGSLAQVRGRASAEVLRLAAPVASALAHAHAAGLVHRDVKPANVLLMSDGTPRLADFGIATSIAAASQGRAGYGSLYNMSPQQLDGEPASPADDVYAFGAMLYELLSGYPPFYPNADAHRIRTERPDALPASVSQEVAQLIDRMLAKSPAERPATMDTVERELKAASAATNEKAAAQPQAVHIEPPSLRAPGAPGEPLRGEWRRSSPSGVGEQQWRREGFRRGLAAAAIMLGILGVLVVFFALPEWIGERSGRSDTPIASTPGPEPATQDQERQEIDFAALARAKQEAEELRAPLLERLQKLREQAVDVWGAADIKRLQEELAAADRDVEAREYLAAVEHFKNADPLLKALESRTRDVLRAQLDAGARALQEGRSGDAQAAFALALKIDPQNQTATQGVKRAGTLDEVLELVATAERLEKEGDSRAAVEHYRKAIALDAEAPRAKEGVARIEAQLASDAFASAMARGFSALASADHAAARNAFEAARKIRPNAPEVDQAIRQIEQEQRTGIIGTKLRAAQTLESQEQWAQALQEYRAVLELDSTVAAANEGVARVAPRAALNEQLELYLTQPERLFSQPVRAAARESLARAQAISDPGPLLRQQISTLTQWLERADVPVEVALQSDNLTQVTIYRVGELGTFEQRSLELAPGTYTVVGTRPGYRDVRRRIDVMPGAALEPIVIRCEDRI